MFTQKRLVTIPLALAIVAGAVLLFSALGSDHGTSTAQAQGNGGDPVLTVSPNPAPLGATSINISGSGFRAGKSLMVGPRGVIPTVTVTTDASGAFSITYTPWVSGFTYPGNYPVDAMMSRGNKTLIVATTNLWVCFTNPC